MLAALPSLGLWKLDRPALADFDEGIHARVSLEMVDGGAPGADPFAPLAAGGGRGDRADRDGAAGSG